MQRMEHVTLRKEGEIHRKVKIRLPCSEGYLSVREIAQGVLRTVRRTPPTMFFFLKVACEPRKSAPDCVGEAVA